MEIADAPNFQGHSSALVVFTFMPLGAAIGGVGGALLFGTLAARDSAIPVERRAIRPRDR